MAKQKIICAIFALYTNEVSMLYINQEKIIADRKSCNSTSDWSLVISQLFSRYKISSKTQVRVILGASLYNTVQLPKNEFLTEAELRSIAMSKDLESAVNGNISDYAWDFYDARTGKNSKPMQNFVLVTKKLISSISETINKYAVLYDITNHDLAMAQFISLYQYYASNKRLPDEPVNYVKQLCIALYLDTNHDLMVYGVFGGELCYSRALKGYRNLGVALVLGQNDPLLTKLVIDISRIRDDFLMAQLGLPPMSRLLLMMKGKQIEAIADVLNVNFPRVLEVIPIADVVINQDTKNYNVCKDPIINQIAEKDINYLPLLGLAKEGLLNSEEN